MSDSESPLTSTITLTDRLDLIPRYLPAGQPHFLSGPPGGGKTAFVAGLIQAVRLGKPIFGKATQAPPFIGFISADREWADSRRWYDAAGLPELPYFSIVDSDITRKQLRNPEFALVLLEQILTQQFKAPPYSLIVIDPISYWAGCDMNRYLAVWLAMVELNRVCKRHQITILGIAHTGKQKGDSKERYSRPQDRINGSAALLGCSGTQMALETPDQTESAYYRFSWIPHHAKAESYDLERDEHTGLFREASTTPSLIVPYPAVLECIPYPPADPLTPKLLLRVLDARQLLIAPATLFRCLKTWQTQGLIAQPARGQYLRTPVQ